MAVELDVDGCYPGDPWRKRFCAPVLGIELIVPNAYEETLIRQRLNRGAVLYTAYMNDILGQGSPDIYPVAPMQPCIEEVLRAKCFNPDTGRYIICTGQFTCVEFRKCFDQYVRATVAFPDKPKGRMEIATGVYAPGSSEERCIKANFHKSGKIAGAYTFCGATDIIPDWTGALEVMATALTKEPGADLYNVIKMAYMMEQSEPEPEPIPPVHHGIPIRHEPTADVVKVDWMFILAAAGVVYLASRR